MRLSNKIKVGDKVKIINNEIFNPDLGIGDIGEISAINGDLYVISFTKNGESYKQICSTFKQYIKKI